jgi:hypothetical protein
MSAPVEILCGACYRETIHQPRATGLLVCITCGTVTTVGDRLSMNGTDEGRCGGGDSGVGDSGEGVSCEGDSETSLTSNAFAADAYANRLHGHGLAALDCDQTFARFVVEKAGMRFLQDEAQAVALGSTSIRGRLWVDHQGHYVLRTVGNECFPGSRRRALKLGQLYASVCAGQLVFPTGPMLARWKRQAMVETGAVIAPVVTLEALPADAPPYVPPIWDGIARLIAVRRLTDPDEKTVPLCRSCIADWCGCGELTARRALGWLERNRFIWRAAHVDVRRPKPMTLWGVAESGGLQ